MSAELWGEVEVQYFFLRLSCKKVIFYFLGHILYNDPNQGLLRTRACYTNSFGVQSALNLWREGLIMQQVRRKAATQLMKPFKPDKDGQKMHPASSRLWPFLVSDTWCTQSGLLVTSLAWWLTFFCTVCFKNKSPSLQDCMIAPVQQTKQTQ